MDNVKAVKGVEMEKSTTSAARQEDTDQWILYVDGVSNKNGFGVGQRTQDLLNSTFWIPDIE